MDLLDSHQRLMYITLSLSLSSTCFPVVLMICRISCLFLLVLKSCLRVSFAPHPSLYLSCLPSSAPINQFISSFSLRSCHHHHPVSTTLHFKPHSLSSCLSDFSHWLQLMIMTAHLADYVSHHHVVFSCTKITQRDTNEMRCVTSVWKITVILKVHWCCRDILLEDHLDNYPEHLHPRHLHCRLFNDRQIVLL